jgi:hypothetical protein
MFIDDFPSTNVTALMRTQGPHQLQVDGFKVEVHRRPLPNGGHSYYFLDVNGHPHRKVYLAGSAWVSRTWLLEHGWKYQHHCLSSRRRRQRTANKIDHRYGETGWLVIRPRYMRFEKWNAERQRFCSLIGWSIPEPCLPKPKGLPRGLPWKFQRRDAWTGRFIKKHT